MSESTVQARSENEPEPRRNLPAVEVDSSQLKELGISGDSENLARLWEGLPDDEDVIRSRAAAHTLPQDVSPSTGSTTSSISGREKYVIEGEIDRGGMGIVLKAFDNDMRRPVGMKVLPAGADREQRARFVEEAQVTGQLEHPNIVPIHGLGMDRGGRLFFTMKLLKGRSLAAILDEVREYPDVEQARYPLCELVHALVHAMNAVAYAHARGVVHRDLKPANIWIGDFGEVYVMDWGLARVGAARGSRRGEPIYPPAPPACSTGMADPSVRRSPAAGSAADATPSVEPVTSQRRDSWLFITRDGTIAGTPAYMSPEQARGDIRAVDERSDVYGLGAILYEILTLHPPVSGASDQEFIEQVKRGRIIPPRRRARHRGIPPELASTAMRALQFAPEKRFQSVEEMKRELVLFMNRTTIVNTPEPLGVGLMRLARQHPLQAGLLAGSLLALLAAGAAVHYPALERIYRRLRAGTRQAAPAPRPAPAARGTIPPAGNNGGRDTQPPPRRARQETPGPVPGNDERGHIGKSDLLPPPPPAD